MNARPLMPISVSNAEFFLRDLHLRTPFRYGIVTMTRVPHLIVRLSLEIGGQPQCGFSADQLPPKWFTKNPATSFRDDITEMLEVIRHATDLARALPPQPTVFSLWRELNAQQRAWAKQRGFPPLLAGFGVSLVERAVIDAFCRATGRRFADAVRENTLSLDLGAIYPELSHAVPADLLPPQPARSVIVRHTVGLSDPLADADIDAAHRVNDGLPQSLEEFIRVHGLTHFKIKLSGDLEESRARMHRIVELIRDHAERCAFSLDGNENYHSVAPFRELWEAFRADPIIGAFLGRLLWVEQPFHRDIALSEKTAAELRAWKDRPPFIIDESDSGTGVLAEALAAGYSGTSHKNCKGVFHGLANACLIAHRNRANPSAPPLLLSSEDLTNLGPVSLPQDFAVAATLGITNMERNGHHYFAGLSEFPEEIQHAALLKHGDLYTRHPDGFPMVRIQDGRLQLGSLIDSPFGLNFEPDLTHLTPLGKWTYGSY
jgi:hypothetical protein